MGRVKSIFIATIVICSFLWGYHQETIVSWWRSADVPPSETEQPEAVDTPATRSPAPEASSNTPPSPTPSAVPQTVRTPSSAATIPSPQPATQQPRALASPLPTPVFPSPPDGDYQSPYERFLRESAQKPSTEGSIADTMDSIRPGEVTEEQQVRRNAYFEKLSQQLQELRGDAPPDADSDEAQEAADAPEAEDELSPEDVEDEFVPEFMEGAEQGAYVEGVGPPVDEEFLEGEPYDEEQEFILE